MKENKFSIFGKNLDEITKLKGKTKAGTGRSSDKWTAITDAIEKGDVTSMKEVRKMDPEMAAMREDHWRSLIVESQMRPTPRLHPPRP